MRPEELPLRGARALVLGLGRFSGGVETARFLAQEGASVTVSDASTRPALAASAAEVERLGARTVFGPQTPELLEGRDLVVANPAIPFGHPVLAAAEARGLPVTSEMNLFLARVRAPVVGVTGTKGKSTTTTLLARMLQASGLDVRLGGNVGRSLLAEVATIPATAVVVLELSSFQLWWARRLAWSPRVAVLTNLFPDHLDRHGTMAEYAAAKRGIVEFQGPDDAAVLPADDAAVRDAGFLETGRGRRVLFGPGGVWRLEGGRIAGPAGRTIDLDGFALWGAHNARNALAAAAGALQVPGATAEGVRAGIVAARPLPHRLQPVEEVDGVLFVDDSNSTNPGSTAQALEAVPRPVVVLIGGKDKGLDATPLVEAVARRARAAVGIGTSGPALVRRLEGRIPAVDGGADLETAVRRAARLARAGDAVLLSPGFSSQDQHASFVERGERFQSAVRAWKAAPRAPA